MQILKKLMEEYFQVFGSGKIGEMPFPQVLRTQEAPLWTRPMAHLV